MEIKILILLAMIFCHIVDDYYLQGQGVLALMKQEDWMKENCPDKMYKNDYRAALSVHSFSWSFMTTLVPTIYHLYNKSSTINCILMVLINAYFHYIIDDSKCNRKWINLRTEQFLHLIQIIFCWYIVMF